MFYKYTIELVLLHESVASEIRNRKHHLQMTLVDSSLALRLPDSALLDHGRVVGHLPNGRLSTADDLVNHRGVASTVGVSTSPGVSSGGTSMSASGAGVGAGGTGVSTGGRVASAWNSVVAGGGVTSTSRTGAVTMVGPRDDTRVGSSGVSTGRGMEISTDV